MTDIDVETSGRIEIVNITEDVARLAKGAQGAVLVSTPHTTAGIVVNEDESNLRKDMERFYSDLAKGHWAHDTIDDNARAHLAATMLNPSVVIPLKDGELALGTWQSILFVELDGPRQRKVHIRRLGI